MCARRFLIAVFILILLVVAGAFAIYQWGGNILLKQATPVGHFQPSAAGTGPDYKLEKNWLARPGMPIADNASHWLPSGVTATPPGDAAVFYVHPTTYLQRDRWNAGIDADSDTEGRTQLFVRSQASVFSGAGQVWAPRYRQAAYGAFLLKSADATRALDLAYGDVRSAFDEFLDHNPEGPIILAAHSQGSLHLLRLLADYKNQLNGRLVAAYVVGWPVSKDADLPATGFKGCGAPDETSCVLSWQSFGQPANPELVLDSWVGSRGLTGHKRSRESMLCVNPLTGSQDAKAPPAANAGTLVPDASLANGVLEKGLVGAECRNGILEIFGDIPPFGPFVLPGNNFHVYDYALFWANVRHDAERRLAAWQRR